MAPPPEYDKEPKAPDKNLTNNSTDDSKVLYNHIKDHPTNPDHKAVTAGANDVVNDKYVETLDDGQLRALLDEAINYKCPKDREGKSSLFKNLLQEAEEQECEAATRDLGAGRGGRRGRGRHEHHSSLQDLVAAIAGETAPRRGRAHGHAHAHTAPPAATVSARAHHGGSLPSGVDKSFLLSEEASRYEVGGAARGGYLATVRCVNPPPLAERRVSAGDANAPEPAPAPPAPPAPPPAAPAAHPAAHPAAADDARRRAPMFPMTYTARATLEIGSGSVCSGRAVTTTTASNQVRTSPPPATTVAAHHARGEPRGPHHHHQHHHDVDDKYTDSVWMHSVNNWYKNLDRYADLDLNTKSNTSRNSIYINKSELQANKRNTVDGHTTMNASARIDHVVDADARTKHKKVINDKKYKDPFYENICNNKATCDNIRNDRDVFDYNESDISLRKKYRERVGHDLVAPSVSTINPKNFRNMTIGKPTIVDNTKSEKIKSAKKKKKKSQNEVCDKTVNSYSKTLESKELQTVKECSGTPLKGNYTEIEMIETISNNYLETSNVVEIELVNISPSTSAKKSSSFSEFVASQQKLIENIEINNNKGDLQNDNNNITSDNNVNVDKKFDLNDIVKKETSKEIATLSTKQDVQKANEQFFVAELQNNAYIFLTLPKSFLPAAYNKNEFIKVKEIPNNNAKNIEVSKKTNKKSKKTQKEVDSNVVKKNINKNALEMLLYSDSEKSGSVKDKPIKDLEVDSAIPFSCITTPEVVTSCNTTSSTSTVAVDPKPRSVISSNFNGLPLVRPASTTFSNIDEYKKSLDENGNAVQGFNSPLSGSSQHKKPRRKKSSKNETIIKSQEIDGYQGNKDLNEVLRFIESHADGARAPAAKLRAKHHDDERAAKKRSTERRKDKEPKLKRASSLEELSRTTLEELTAAPAPPKPERRSWGDAADADAAPAPHELTDFQTVTKKRKPRRRADDAPEARARARPSAPASDRSNDSNDDADSVTSPPAPPPPPPPPPAPSAPHASYADIARTRHNIPDLIESCNYCAAAPQPAAGAARARKAGKRKEPDVVADRRPAVVLAAGARPRDMDGVTFGFDVNEQLLGGGGCDLLREAEGAGPAAWAALRYVAPAPPPDTQHLHQIIDYVGAAWDDVVRCGGGKVRYFSE